MLFMGEEWGSKAPFPFFCDFEGELAEAVRQGRRREFAGAYAEFGDEVPDPLALSTFQSAVLDWETRGEADGKQAAGAGAGDCSRSAGARSSRGLRARLSAKRMRATMVC